ncbi:MAG: hypothetical protein LC708_02475, partial [Actinobacteria bacterium]|nr:hypothetical protein [Actinomycetota bacterium]
VVVTNTSAVEPVTITALTDNIYGDLATRPGSTCGALIDTTLAPGASSAPCTFTGPFTGNGGANQTDVVTATAVDDDGQTVQANDDATVTLTPVAPAISVVKTADPLSRPEPGGDFTFTVVVTNTSAVEPVTITALTDNIYGDLATRPGSTCGALINTTLAPGASSAPCTFTGPFTGVGGDRQTDVVTATAVDDDGQTVTATDDATVELIGQPPTVTIVKTATPTTRPEPGGTFTFTFVVTNTSDEPVTITSLTDDIYGDLNGRGTCALGAVLAPGASYTCSFSTTFTGNAGANQTDVATVIVRDDQGNTSTDNDDALINLTDVPPTVQVEKTADPLSLPEPGGRFTFKVVVTNTSNEPVTITSLTDNVYGNLNGQGNCAIGAVLPVGGTYTCSFPGDFIGDANQSQTDEVTVVVRDEEGSTATAKDTAVVTLTDVPPTIAVTKTPSPTSLLAPGGNFTFTVAVTNTSAEPVRITSLTDDIYGDLNGQGTCAVGTTLLPGETYTCSFQGAFTGSGGATQTDTVTAIAVDNENTQATAQAKAVVSLEAPVLIIPKPPAPPIAFTGRNLDGPARIATALVILGMALVASTWQSHWRPALSGAGLNAFRRSGGWGPDDDGPGGGLRGLLPFWGSPPGGGSGRGSGSG